MSPLLPSCSISTRWSWNHAVGGESELRRTTGVYNGESGHRMSWDGWERMRRHASTGSTKLDHHTGGQTGIDTSNADSVPHSPSILRPRTHPKQAQQALNLTEPPPDRVFLAGNGPAAARSSKSWLACFPARASAVPFPPRFRGKRMGDSGPASGCRQKAWHQVGYFGPKSKAGRGEAANKDDDAFEMADDEQSTVPDRVPGRCSKLPSSMALPLRGGSSLEKWTKKISECGPTAKTLSLRLS
ncbi:hypothetical protein BO71DRAFT_412693 [Aspergillus ellipticus CBS 707.79]|uniref:Uncharacterized protein n=1 Tax=Aspergillus ellipticus CBS 707.79 TaxID=1448320 RepID=A0A319D701_9EURO|nr:hypothetical protein BO71DRAFT_412693 [Aspergillus ellipticus CBS 707.79]